MGNLKHYVIRGGVEEAGFSGVEVSLTQPVGLEGDVKLLHPITLENVADAIVEASLASREEVDVLISPSMPSQRIKTHLPVRRGSSKRGLGATRGPDVSPRR
jgi:hypothetical protein